MRHRRRQEALARSRKTALTARLALEKSSIGLEPSVEGEEGSAKAAVEEEGGGEGGEGAQAGEAGREDSGAGAKSFDVELSSECSWISQSLRLLPGEYCLLADVALDIPYPMAFQLSLPKNRSETPWFDFYQPPADAEVAQLGKTRREPPPSGERSVGSKRSEGSHAQSITFSMLSPSSSMRRVAEEIKRASAADTSVEHNVWLQSSSTDEILIAAFGSFSSSPLEGPPLDGEIKSIKRGSTTSVEDMVVLPEKGPFMAESQLEVSSRELTKLLCQLKSEAVAVGAEVVALTAKYKDLRRSQLRSEKQSKAKS